MPGLILTEVATEASVTLPTDWLHATPKLWYLITQICQPAKVCKSHSLVTGFINVCNCIGSAAAYLIVCGQTYVV